MGLWKLEREVKDQNDDENNPLYGASRIETGSDGGLVNILDEYTWTISPKSSRVDAPYIYLIEKRVTQDTIVQQAIYNLKAIYETGEVSAETLSKALQNVTDLEDDSDILEVFKGQEEETATIKNEKTSEKEKDTLNNPYKGLYALEDTGWQYVFPYFTQTKRDLSQAWGDAEGKGITGKINNALVGAVESGVTDVQRVQAVLAGTTGSVEAPIITYIEKPKQYSYGSSTPQYSFNFHLFNTHKYEDIVKNWELCFLLIYQNLPNRKSKAIIDPPALYEVVIPGIKNSPLSYISSLRIDFVGATRLMDLQVGLDKKSIKSIVPDAYRITITINDLFPESKNFLEGVVDLEKRITISEEETNYLFERDGSFEINDARKSLFESVQSVVSNATDRVREAVNGVTQKASNSVKNKINGIFGGGG